jgi:hypothetical protein
VLERIIPSQYSPAEKLVFIGTHIIREPAQVALLVPPGQPEVEVPLVLNVLVPVKLAVVLPQVVTVDAALTLVTVPLVITGSP